MPSTVMQVVNPRARRVWSLVCYDAIRCFQLANIPGPHETEIIRGAIEVYFDDCIGRSSVFTEAEVATWSNSWCVMSIDVGAWGFEGYRINSVTREVSSFADMLTMAVQNPQWYRRFIQSGTLLFGEEGTVEDRLGATERQVDMLEYILSVADAYNYNGVHGL